MEKQKRQMEEINRMAAIAQAEKERQDEEDRITAEKRREEERIVAEKKREEERLERIKK